MLGSWRLFGALTPPNRTDSAVMPVEAAVQQEEGGDGERRGEERR